MPTDRIIVLDRYTGKAFEEAVYGDGALRFAYGSAFGRLLTRLFFARPACSRLFGWYMKRSASRQRIQPFIEKYQLDAGEFLLSPDAFGSFNEFFHRELRPECRPVDADPASVVFPADARHTGWQEVGTESRVFVKGQAWDVPQLLDGREDLVSRFSGGSLVLSRLCPVDYHHFHYPVGGRPLKSWWTGRDLYSVSPIALRRRLDYLWSNKRRITVVEGAGYGSCCIIEIGATNVGTIRQRPLPQDGTVAKGDPKGWFEFGGSSVVTLFPRGAVELSRDLVEQTGRGVELYARVGDRMGVILDLRT